MKIYEIPALWRQILDSVEIDEETGEILYNEEQLNFVEEAEQKLSNTALYIKEQQAEADVLAEHIKRLQARKKGIESRCDWLKKLSQSAMQQIGLQKVKTAEITVSLRTANSPVYSLVPDYKALKPEYVKISYELNKTAIRDAIKANEGVVPPDLADVVTLESKTSLSIR